MHPVRLLRLAPLIRFKLRYSEIASAQISIELFSGCNDVREVAGEELPAGFGTLMFPAFWQLAWTGNTYNKVSVCSDFMFRPIDNLGVHQSLSGFIDGCSKINRAHETTG